MASTSQQQQSYSPADAALPLFARGVLSLLTIWPALRLALSHGWSNKNATTSGAIEKRTNLAEELVDAYYSSYTGTGTDGSPEISAIEDFLVEYVEAEYGVGLEDGSEQGIARDLQKMWKECLTRVIQQSQGAATSEGMVERFEQLAQKAREEDGDPSKAFRGTKSGGQDDDDDDDDSDSEENDEGGEGYQGHRQADNGMDVDETPAQRQREEPIVDEDGFTMVPSKGKRR